MVAKLKELLRILNELDEPPSGNECIVCKLINAMFDDTSEITPIEIPGFATARSNPNLVIEKSKKHGGS
ncbi:MAG: hypothetical protein ACFFFK_03540 [Candidatus Thorarchaeota archaeon]